MKPFYLIETGAASQSPVKYTTIGGQALLEGILMKGPRKVAIATRSPSGEITCKVEPVGGLAQKNALFRRPFFRGIAALYDSMKRGMAAMEYAAAQLEEEEEEEPPGRLARWLGPERAEALESVGIFTTAIGLAIVLFFFLPTVITGWLRPILSSSLALNAVEGVLRIVLFLGYVVAIGHMKEMRRVFMYHGAEHKTIACYEHGEALTVENVQRYPRVHPRCGTSFLANLVILSALMLSFFGWPNPLLRLVLRLAILPILVGLTYELNLWMGRHDHALSRFLRLPGLFVQRVATVKEPEDDMVEVAIVALEAVIPEDPEEDRW